MQLTLSKLHKHCTSFANLKVSQYDFDVKFPFKFINQKFAIHIQVDVLHDEIGESFPTQPNPPWIIHLEKSNKLEF